MNGERGTGNSEDSKQITVFPLLPLSPSPPLPFSPAPLLQARSQLCKTCDNRWIGAIFFLTCEGFTGAISPVLHRRLRL
ncbi:Transaldolase [Geitlerinema sp. FC II]|nr:Transaldolase [Geitlerinema sp. FC II]